MNKITIETPCIINGVLLTENILSAIDLLQFGGSYGCEIEEKTTQGAYLPEKLADCKDIAFYMNELDLLKYSPTDGVKEREMLTKLFWLHDLLENFAIPPDVEEKLMLKGK